MPYRLQWLVTDGRNTFPPDDAVRRLRPIVVDWTEILAPGPAALRPLPSHLAGRLPKSYRDQGQITRGTALMALIRGFFTADLTVLFELERGLTRLETEQFAVTGKPLPEKLARARSEMRMLIEHSATHESNSIERSMVDSATGPATIGVMEASQILNRTPQTVRRHCENGSLQAVQAVKNGSWRILRASVEQRRQKWS
jgi:hypothetical protein